MLEAYTIQEYVSVLAAGGLVTEVEVPPPMLRGCEITCLTYDSRAVSPNAMYICKGVHFREEYLREAAGRGAVVYVSEKRYDSVDLPYILVRDIRRAMAYLAIVFFNDAPSRLTSVGITGTKGKSTTAYYVKAILDEFYPKECAILSSIDNYDGVSREESHLTTPEAVELHRHFENACESGISHLVMEVSSQALKYDRVFGIRFGVACFTNIGTDHISPVEHPDFEDYFASKLKIFDDCAAACINTDMEHAERVLAYAREKHCRILTFGSHPEDDIFCQSREKRADGIYFTVRTPAFTRTLHITMPGMFNVENALAAVAVATALKLPPEAIERGLAEARAPGRMEVFESRDKRVTVLVDYAHNRMSFDALVRSAEVEYPGKRRIVVFGCPGRKAQLRRRDLGEMAGLHCDLAILTEEDPGEEPVHKISEEIGAYVAAAGGKYVITDDRGEAIREAILENGTDKVIFLTGKGRETRQKRGTLYIDTPSDVDFTEKYLAAYDAAAKPAVR